MFGHHPADLSAAVNLKKIDIEYFKLNGKSHKEIKEIMMATSAIPLIFGRQNIGGVNYIDGGVEILNGNNLPITPLYNEDCDEIIVINLYKDAAIEKNKNFKVYEIIPSKDIGDFFTGAMDFSLEGARMRLEEGYNDAKNLLERISKMGKNHIEIMESSSRMYEDEINNQIINKQLKHKLHDAIDNLRINDDEK